MTKRDTYEEIADRSGSVLDGAHQLREIARAMTRVGMDQLSDELWLLAERLKGDGEALRTAAGRVVNDQYCATSDATGLMLVSMIERAARSASEEPSSEAVTSN